MNKKQLIVVGAIVVAICIVLFTAPRYIIAPGIFVVETSEYRIGRIYSNESSYTESLKKKFGVYTEWEKVAHRSIPILLIGGFLVLMLNKKKQNENKELVNPGDATHTHEQK